MFIKKIEGRRAVTLQDGTIFTRADLPPENTERWVASRKAAVVRGVAYGLLSQEEALEKYGLTQEEFDEWVKAITRGGLPALRATYRSSIDNLKLKI